MTREEAIKFLSNTKVYVNGKSREIQEKLFSLGFQWKGAGKQVLNERKPFLFLWEDMEICYSDNMEHFTKKAFREITANDILNIVIDEPKYRPFKDAEECFEEMKKHEPFGWITNDAGDYFLIIHLSEDRFNICCNLSQTYIEALNIGQRFADGKPFGIKEEEES